jgi:gas vesicle protein
MDAIDSSDQKRKNPFSAGLGFAVAMALGATLGILFAPKEGAETQKDIMEKAQQLANKFNKNREDVQTIVKNIFGEVNDELEKDYLELQGHILAMADDIKDKTGLDQKKYDKIVHDAVKQFSKGRKWTEKSINALIEEFNKDWK